MMASIFFMSVVRDDHPNNRVGGVNSKLKNIEKKMKLF
jgi:hypothetical protein